MLDSGWQARLSLSFVRDGARTALHERRHEGPLRVQRPFYPEGAAVCHVYLLHPPGGVVVGDQLRVAIDVTTGAHALITSPAATKLYRGAGGVDARAGASDAADAPGQGRQVVSERTDAARRFGAARQCQVLRVEDGAVLEWLPQETIAFEGTRADLSTRIELTGGACYFGWDVLCLGRPATGERFGSGCLHSAIELARDQRPLYLEQARYEGGAAVLTAAWGLFGQPIVGSLLCAAPGIERHVELARAALQARDLQRPALAAVSCFDGVLCARYVGGSAEQAREVFCALWSALRPALFEREASPPRVWAT